MKSKMLCQIFRMRLEITLLSQVSQNTLKKNNIHLTLRSEAIKIPVYFIFFNKNRYPGLATQYVSHFITLSLHLRRDCQPKDAWVAVAFPQKDPTVTIPFGLATVLCFCVHPDRLWWPSLTSVPCRFRGLTGAGSEGSFLGGRDTPIPHVLDPLLGLPQWEDHVIVSLSPSISATEQVLGFQDISSRPVQDLSDSQQPLNSLPVVELSVCEYTHKTGN